MNKKGVVLTLSSSLHFLLLQEILTYRYLGDKMSYWHIGLTIYYMPVLL